MASTSRAVRSSPPPTTPVGVFWDYENCRLPAKLSGFTAVSLIRAVAHTYGHVQLIKAYMETSLERAGRASSIRSELQSSGVSIIDTPHNGSKDVADKMILVDMLVFALDTKAPATVVLISGDKDFAYVLSTLRNRRYKVIVIAPEHASASLTSQADELLDWRHGGLGLSKLRREDKSQLREEKPGKKGRKKPAVKQQDAPKRTPVILQPMARGEQRYKPYDVPSYATRAEVPARGEVGGSRAKGANLEELSEKHWRESWEESARTAVGGARMQGSSKGVEEGKGKKVEVIELLDTDEEEEMEMERSRGKKERKRERRALRRAAEEVAVEGREVGVEEGDAEGKGKGKARRVQDAMIILGTSSPSPPPENFSATTNDVPKTFTRRSPTLPLLDHRPPPPARSPFLDDRGYSSSMDTSLTMDTTKSSTVSPWRGAADQDDEDDDDDEVAVLVSRDLGMDG